MPDSLPKRSDWLGGVTGILVFLGGIGLLVLTFSYAFDMFAVPPRQALQVSETQPVELGRTAESFVQVVQRILLLLVMSVLGSVIANRGIRLYAESRGEVDPRTPKPAPEADKRAEAA